MSTHPSEARLKLHGSPGMRMSCLMLTDNFIAMAGAATGLCWTGPGRPKVKLTPADLGTYGVLVYDDIVNRDGVTEADFWACATKALKLITDAAHPSDDEVQAHRENSETAPSGP